MISSAQAESFSAAWIDAWNSHDLDRVMAHYADDIVFHSPRIAIVTGEAVPSVRGKAALRSYWGRALESSPELQFSIEDVLLGSDALTIIYRNHRGQRAAETFIFDQTGLVMRSVATYE